MFEESENYMPGTIFYADQIYTIDRVWVSIRKSLDWQASNFTLG